MLSLGPFSVEYPVNFRSGGDTTKDAFWKHIQEIERIYGLLTAIDAAAASSDSISGAISGELQQHINSTNPHPNWKPSLSFDDITGNLAASRVVGKLTNATIDAGKVNGLSEIIGGEIPDPPDLNEVFPSTKIQTSGYVKLINGLIFQWGISDDLETDASNTSKFLFPTEFSNRCFLVIGSLSKVSGPVGGDAIRFVEWDKTSFTCFRFAESHGYGPPFSFMAIGY